MTDTPTNDNPGAIQDVQPSNVEPAATPAADAPWYSGLSPDLANNPTLQKYKNAEAAHQGHLELASRLGGDNVTWPKGKEDQAGWNDIHARMGVPENSDDYKLPHVDLPDSLDGTLDRFGFQQQMADIKATPDQAAALWDNYTGMILQSIADAETQHQERINNAKAEMQQEWGEAYEAKIQRGQSVLNHFAGSEAELEELTVALSGVPTGQRFLAGIGDMMAESQVGGFQERQNFTLTPEEARQELSAIKANPNYRSDDETVRIPLVNRANELMKMVGAGSMKREII